MRLRRTGELNIIVLGDQPQRGVAKRIRADSSKHLQKGRFEYAEQ